MDSEFPKAFNVDWKIDVMGWSSRTFFQGSGCALYLQKFQWLPYSLSFIWKRVE